MTGINKWITHLTKNQVSIFPLVVFRIVFGILMFFSTLRFILKGWVHDLYEVPTYFFTYYGFDWVSPLPNPFMYVLFLLLLITCIFIIRVGSTLLNQSHFTHFNYFTLSGSFITAQFITLFGI